MTETKQAMTPVCPHCGRAPPQPVAQPEKGPLPVEEIIKIWNDMGNDPIAPSVFSFIACVRKTEQAHGIGEKK